MPSIGADLPERLLVVSGSARMLARSAARAGIRPVALDLYADEDTRGYAEIAVAVAPDRIGFDADGLLDAAARFAPAERYALVYGSGLDVAPGLLEQLILNRELYGNPPEILRHLKTPDTFFELLRRLRIPFPEIQPIPPADPQNWLIKAGCSEGGKGVRFCARDRPAGEGEYYQRRLPGPPMSVLFLADGERARILGYNTLWTASHFGRPFLFTGAVNRTELSREQREDLRAYVLRLVRTVGLKGLNSLDFMLDGEVCRVLEVNPRPSATMALYDRDFPEGLMVHHIHACRGWLGGSESIDAAPVRAFAAIFAPRPVTVSAAVAWPDWCVDRPAPGSPIGAGQPLCTVEAEGNGRREVEALIARRKTALWQRLCSAHG